MYVSRWIARGAVVGAMAVSAVVFASSSVSDRVVAEDALKRLGPSRKVEAVSLELGKAQQLLERARRLRAVGDEPHAEMAERAARAWTDAADVRLKAISEHELEIRIGQAAVDAGRTLEREQVLYDEQMAENGRLRAQVDTLDLQGPRTNDALKRGGTKGTPVRGASSAEAP